MNRPGSARLSAALPLAAVAALAAGLVLSGGCTKPTTGLSTTDGTKGTETRTDPWEAAARRLRKETDPAACKAALGQLNNDLSTRTDLSGPPALAPEAEKAIAALVPLNAQDVEEIRPSSYTGLDPLYLASCFYLRDAARAIAPGGVPPADRARAGFAWVCRQVYLNPWLLGDQLIPAVPPVYILRRGSGTGLERAYVFLALLQQMGLEGCLIGPPDVADKPAGFGPKGPDGKPFPGTPRGPFWAVGAQVGADILVFDPWRGCPFPGPDGAGVATLAQLKTGADRLKTWPKSKDAPWGPTPEDARAATVYLALPVSALSPRMGMLEAKLHTELGVRLAITPADLRARFLAAPESGPGVPPEGLRFWNPPADPFAYGRVLGSFMPSAEGGWDKTEMSRGLFAQYHLNLIPRTVFALPPELDRDSPAIGRLRGAAASQYEAAYFNPPTPREQIQRGLFQDAARDLTERQQVFGRGVERLRSADPGRVAEWCKRVNEVYAALRAAQYPNPLQTSPLPDTDPAVAAARAEVEAFWKDHAATAQLIIDAALARIGRAEATFLLALEKHEEAERLQTQDDRPSGRAAGGAAGAWGEAANAWAAYLEQAEGLSGFPGRNAHARTLAERAREQAGVK